MEYSNNKNKFQIALIIGVCLIFVIITTLILTLILKPNSQIVSYNPQVVDFNSTKPTDDYSITNYDISISISDKNVLTVREEIRFYFYNTELYGIIRSFPIYNTIYYLDGNGTKNYKLSYELGAITKFFDAFEENDYLYIQVGNPLLHVSEIETYVFNYTVNLGDDRIKDYDQFYYNVLGDDWDCEVEQLSYNIKFPKSFDSDIIKQYYGEYGADKVGIDLVLNNKTISGSLTDIAPFSAVTLRVLLPNDYFGFTGPIWWVDLLILLTVLIVITLLIIGFYKYHNKKQPIQVIEFESPDNMTPAEAGYIIDRKMNKSEIASLIVYWANKGFISLEDDKQSLKLTKLMEPDNTFLDYELKLFNSIFLNSKTADLSNPTNSTAMAVMEAKRLIVAKYKDVTFSEKAIAIKNIMLIFFGIINAVVFWVLANRVVNTIFNLFTTFIFAGVLGVSALLFCYSKEHKSTNSKFSTVFLTVAPLICITFVFVMGMWTNFEVYSDPLMLVFVIPFVSILLVWFSFIINVRTDKGNEITGKLLGLRQYILVAEKDKIEMLAKDNPKVFYNVLPYAYVLGVSNVWIKKFENINIPVPDWYHGDNNIFIGYMIISSLNRSNSFFTPVIKSRTNGGGGLGGGGFSGGGGGFSGGGFGGGGGRGW